MARTLQGCREILDTDEAMTLCADLRLLLKSDDGFMASVWDAVEFSNWDVAWFTHVAPVVEQLEYLPDIFNSAQLCHSFGAGHRWALGHMVAEVAVHKGVWEWVHPEEDPRERARNGQLRWTSRVTVDEPFDFEAVVTKWMEGH